MSDDIFCPSDTGHEVTQGHTDGQTTLRYFKGFYAMRRAVKYKNSDHNDDGSNETSQRAASELR